MSKRPDVSWIFERIKTWNLRPVAILAAAAFLVAGLVSLVIGYWLVGLVRSTDLAGAGVVHPNVTESMGMPLPAAGPSRQAPTLDDRGLEVILQRNIFNSEGAHGGEGDRDAEAGGDPSKAVRTNLPLRLVGTIYGGTPKNGIALIENTERKRVNTFVVGDTIAVGSEGAAAQGADVVEIHQDRVILLNEGRREFLEVVRAEVKRSRRDRKKGATAPAISTQGIAPIATEPPPENYKEEGFERTGTRMAMTQDFRDRLLKDDFAKVLQDAKASPSMVGGKIQGWELTRIRKDSIYEKAGFQNGDIVLEINGVSLSDAGKAIQFLNGIRNEPEFEVRYIRKGQSQTRTIQVR